MQTFGDCLTIKDYYLVIKVAGGVIYRCHLNYSGAVSRLGPLFAEPYQTLHTTSQKLGHNLSCSFCTLQASIISKIVGIMQQRKTSQ